MATGHATLDFGATPSDYAEVSVVGQAGILSTSLVDAFFQGVISLDGDEEDHLIAAANIRLACGIPTAGVGFTIYAFADQGLVKGTLTVSWVWAEAIVGGTGDVGGPGVAVDSRIAVFDGTTGKLLKDGGATIATLTPVPIVQTVTSTGTVNDLTLTAGVNQLRLNNASALTLTGLSAGYAGQQLTVLSVGAGGVTLSHQAAGSTAANRLMNIATSGGTPLAAGVGHGTYEYDGTAGRWRLLTHEQGAAIVLAYSAGMFSVPNGTWTVDSGDFIWCTYMLRGRHLTVSLLVATTTTTGAPATLRLAIPGGFTVNAAWAALSPQVVYTENNSTWLQGGADAQTGATFLSMWKQYAGAAWANVTNLLAVSMMITIEVA